VGQVGQEDGEDRAEGGHLGRDDEDGKHQGKHQRHAARFRTEAVFEVAGNRVELGFPKARSHQET